MKKQIASQLTVPVVVLMAAVILFAMLGTCNGKEQLGAGVFKEKDWIDKGLDLITGKSDEGIFVSAGGVKAGVGVITEYSKEERLMFVVGVGVLVSVIVLVTCCCCAAFAKGTRSPRSIPPPVYIVPANANHAAAATMGTDGASAPLYPTFSNLNV